MVPRPLYPYQQALLDVIKKPADKRAIIWVYEQIGNTGKTAFARELHINNQFIYASKGTEADIKQMMTAEAKAKDENKNKSMLIELKINGLVINLTRENVNKAPYSVMEAIKDRVIFSGKYKSASYIFEEVPHVIVMANAAPDYDKLSKDRWQIWHIKPNKGADIYTFRNGNLVQTGEIMGIPEINLVDDDEIEL
jgi:hypothetical protein